MLRYFLPLCAIITLACGGRTVHELASWTPEPGIHSLRTSHAGVEREILIQLPTGYNPNRSYPLVLGFHGAGRTNEDWPDWLSEVAVAHEFIGIYPQGVRSTWETRLQDREIDDVGFTSALIAWADTALAVDSSRRYAAGFSMGAFLVSRLACEIRGLAGIAALAGTFHQDPQFRPVAPPRRIFIAHGINDNVIPYEGGMAEHGEFFEPAENVAHRWSLVLGCNQGPSVSSLSERVTEIRYSPCRGAGSVLLLKVNTGHHVYEYVDGFFTMMWDFWEAGR